MKATIIIIVVALIVWGARKWFISLINNAWGGKGRKPSQGGNGGTDTPENDNPDNVKPSK